MRHQPFVVASLSILASVAVLAATAGCGAELPSAPASPAAATSPAPAPTPGPAPSPGLTRYRVSGVVTDESGSPVGNMQVGISYDEFFHSVRTSTNGAGYYELAVETALRSAGGVIGLFGVVHAGGGNKYEFSAQPLPAGPSEIVKNVRLRQIRTINAGDSITLSIEPDSSVAWDGEDWNVLNSVWEKLHIRVPRAGTLTVEARPEAGASAPSLAVLCILVSDNCLGEWVKPPLGSGTASLKVQADSRFEIRVVTRSPTSPQRYVVSTSTSE